MGVIHTKSNIANVIAIFPVWRLEKAQFIFNFKTLSREGNLRMILIFLTLIMGIYLFDILYWRRRKLPPGREFIAYWS